MTFLRKLKSKLSKRTSASEGNSAFVYVDGKIFTGSTHNQIVSANFNEKDQNNFMKFKQGETLDNLEHNISFGYFYNDVAVIENNFTNTTLDRVASSLQQIGVSKTFSLPVMHGDSTERLAKLKSLHNA